MTIRSKQAEFIKYLLYFLIIVTVYSLQNCSYFSLMPRKITINLLPFFIAAAALLEPRPAAAGISVFIGALADASSMSADGLMIIYCFIAGIALSFIAQRYFQKMLPVCMLLGSAVLLVQHFLAYVFYSSAAYSIGIADALLSVSAELFVSATCFIPVFVLMKKISGRFTVSDSE